MKKGVILSHRNRIIPFFVNTFVTKKKKKFFTSKNYRMYCVLVVTFNKIEEVSIYFVENKLKNISLKTKMLSNKKEI